jgi:Uma2 family endonuclease
MALPEYPNIGVEDYLLLDNNSTESRYEYLDGELKMLAGGSTYHSIIAANVAGLLFGLLGDSPCTVYNSDIRLQLSKSRYVYPDVTISCDPRDQELGNTIHHPRVVIEILSPSTEIIDRIKKFAYYRACASIQEYVMIDSQQILVEVYRRKDKGWFLTTFGLEDNLELESLNIQMPVKDIYRKITF